MPRVLTASASLAVALGVALPARAQTSVYVVGGLANYTFFNNGTTTSRTKGDTGGFGGGLFYNFPIQSRVTVGLDGRVTASPGSKGGVLAGAALRVGFVPHHVPLRPYFQLGGGFVHSSYTQTLYLGSVGSTTGSTTVQQSVTNGAAQVVFGLDLPITSHVDVRAPELGAEAGGGNGLHVGGSFLNVGLVYHVHPSH